MKDIYPGTNGAFSTTPTNNHLARVGGTIYFGASDGVHGNELWKSDGSPEGTIMVKDIRPGTGNANPKNLVEFKAMLFFAADGGQGSELWKSDGSPEGTALVKDINTQLPFLGSDPAYLTPVSNLLFFSASESVNGRELWTSDGTTEGTALVKDIYPGSMNGLAPIADGQRLLAHNNAVFFIANDLVHGRELWKSDGTPAGTVLVKDIRPGDSHGDLAELVRVGETTFFSANDGIHGREIWKSDGTAEGTVLVRDIVVGSSSSQVSKLTAVGRTLFFSANDGDHGSELWKSDGSAQGTVMVKDLAPGGFNSSSAPDQLTAVDETLFFVTQFRQLWRSDGSDGGGGGGDDAQRIFLPLVRR